MFERVPQLKPRRLLYTSSRVGWCCFGSLPPGTPLGGLPVFSTPPANTNTNTGVGVFSLFLYPWQSPAHARCDFSCGRFQSHSLEFANLLQQVQRSSSLRFCNLIVIVAIFSLSSGPLGLLPQPPTATSRQKSKSSSPRRAACRRDFQQPVHQTHPTRPFDFGTTT